MTRTPFPGNKIPTSRVDPLSASLMKQFWAPNNPGQDITGTNNFEKGFNEQYNYYNFSERADYNISDKWKVFGRVAHYNTTDLQGNPTPNNSELFTPTGTARAGWDSGGDAVWTVNPRTVVEFRGSWHDLLDAYVSSPLPSSGWGSIWPNNNWYQPYITADKGMPLYFPDMNIGGQQFGGGGFYWNQHPKGEGFSARVAQQRGSHYLKAGFEQRESYGLSYVSSTSNFYFNTPLTANTFNNPNTAISGDQFATFLLGSLDSQSQMIGGPVPDPHVQFYGMYLQDDWKVSPRLTLNLGIRNEYETPLYDPTHEFSARFEPDRSGSGDAGQPAADAGRCHLHCRQQLLQLDRPVGLHQQQPSGHVQRPETGAAAARGRRLPHQRQDRGSFWLCPLPDALRNADLAGAGIRLRNRRLPGTPVPRHDRHSEHAGPH